MPRLVFGAFVLDSDLKVLERDGKIVDLRPKLVETLLVLVEAAPRVVSKAEISRRVWADTHVVESALARNISELRQRLGEGLAEEIVIETVAKRGYRFAAPVVVQETTAAAAGSAAGGEARGRRGNLRLLYAGTGLAFGIGFVIWLGFRPPADRNRTVAGAKAVEVAKTRDLAMRTFRSGFSLYDHWTHQALLDAESRFRRTVRLLPDDWFGHFGLAAATLARTLISGSSFAEGGGEARHASELAVLFGPEVAVTHSIRGAVLLLLDWDWAGAEKEIEAGIRWNPNNHVPLGYRGALRVLQGRFDEAAADFDAALALNPEFDDAMLGRAWARYCAADFSGAAAELRDALPRTNKKRPALLLLARALGSLGRFEEAAEALARAEASSQQTLRAEAWLAARAGDAGRARALRLRLRALCRREGLAYADTAAVDVALGNRRAALAGVEEAIRLRHWKALFLAVDPQMAALRVDPRWSEVLSQLGRP